MIKILFWTVLSSYLGWAQGNTKDAYKIDSTHTFALFKVGHLGFSHSYGRFTDVSGTIKWDEKSPDKSEVSVEIKVASLTTQDEKRDKHLKGPDFFNAGQFPLIKFKSRKIKKTADRVYKIEGDLEIHGQTKPVSFDFQRGRTGADPMGLTRTGGDATLKIKRSDFGVNYMLGPEAIPDGLDIILSVEAVKEK